MTPRAALLALGSVTGVLTGRALDGLGLLPGVHESAEVRAIALSPAWTLAGLAACALLAVGVEALLRRTRAGGAAALVLGQLLVLAAPELAGRADQSFGEAPLFVAVGVQLLLSVLTVATVLVVRRELASPAYACLPRWVPTRPTWTATAALQGWVLDIGKGRGPPGGWAPHAPTPIPF